MTRSLFWPPDLPQLFWNFGTNRWLIFFSIIPHTCTSSNTAKAEAPRWSPCWWVFSQTGGASPHLYGLSELGPVGSEKKINKQKTNVVNESDNILPRQLFTDDRLVCHHWQITLQKLYWWGLMFIKHDNHVHTIQSLSV